jgi:hypothetical protein
VAGGPDPNAAEGLGDQVCFFYFQRPDTDPLVKEVEPSARRETEGQDPFIHRLPFRTGGEGLQTPFRELGNRKDPPLISLANSRIEERAHLQGWKIRFRHHGRILGCRR